MNVRYKPKPLPRCTCGGLTPRPHEIMNVCPKCGGLRPTGRFA